MLIAAGHDVIGCDTALFEQCIFDAQPPRLPAIKKDVRDITAWDLKSFDAIVHLASIPSDPLGDINPRITDEINHLATVRLAANAKRAGVRRFVYRSSSLGYGTISDMLTHEDSPPNPLTPYEHAKILAEQGIGALADRNFSPVYLRSGTPYGASPKLRFDLFLNDLTARAYKTGKILLDDDGSTWRSIVHVEDIARAFVAVLTAPIERIHNQAFNVGRTDQTFRSNELASIIMEQLPGSYGKYSPQKGSRKRHHRVSCEKFSGAFGKELFKWDAYRGIASLLSSFKRAETLLQKIDDHLFQRGPHLRMLLHQGVLNDQLRSTTVKGTHTAL